MAGKEKRICYWYIYPRFHEEKLSGVQKSRLQYHLMYYKSLPFMVWSKNQQHQHHLGANKTCEIWLPQPRIKICIQTRTPGNLYWYYHSRTTDRCKLVIINPFSEIILPMRHLYSRYACKQTPQKEAGIVLWQSMLWKQGSCPPGIWTLGTYFCVWHIEVDGWMDEWKAWYPSPYQKKT